jgi:hypothetical protein
MNDPILLASKIITYITEHPSVKYSELEARAVSKGIFLDVFEAAMSAVHRSNKVKRTAIAGEDITYAVIVEKPKKDPMLRWVNIDGNYPAMDSTNDGHHAIFAGLDLKWMFLPPDEAEQYWSKRKPVWRR